MGGGDPSLLARVAGESNLNDVKRPTCLFLKVSAFQEKGTRSSKVLKSGMRV